MIPGIADEKNLAPAYEALQSAIRKYDQRHNVFFEGVTWDFFAAGFKQVPGGAEYRNRSVLSYHYYEPPDFNKKYQFEVRAEDIKRLGCAGFATELLVVSDTAKGLSDMYELFDICDEHMQSWTGWDYKPFYARLGCSESDAKCLDRSSRLNHIYVQNTSRTYPQAVAGYTKGFRFDKNTKKFTLSFAISSNCQSTESLIYFNKDLHYPKGVNVIVNPKGSATWQQNGNFILFAHDKRLPTGCVINISISPK